MHGTTLIDAAGAGAGAGAAAATGSAGAVASVVTFLPLWACALWGTNKLVEVAPSRAAPWVNTERREVIGVSIGNDAGACQSTRFIMRQSDARFPRGIHGVY